MDHNEAVTCVAVSADRQTLGSGSWDKIVKIWEAE
ncbi:hypothetical protein EPA93_45370 [Ktedonosporobacter rubrisoli]|uniref:Uncharacterized protein n=1 Tax=Ktedonosporobacter rubrisoli TaxID=2509675 RepID=A0A4P6K4F5_KTERU|nr:hypothetical protein EPA93_45370 [Ktedonosporobacter rubrisoli]